MYLRPENWLDIIRQDYLDRFIRSGGSAVKFAVLMENIDPDDIRHRFRQAALNGNYAFASVHSEQTRIHMIDQVFFAIARQIDWDRIARSLIRLILTEQGYQCPPDSPAIPDSATVPTSPTSAHSPTIPDARTRQDDSASPVSSGGSVFAMRRLAQMNDRVESEFRRDIHIWIEKALFHRTDLSLEFRIAMIRLCVAQLDNGDDPFTKHLHESVIAWLCGDLRRISELRSALIFQKISRHNARAMLLSLSVFLNISGFSGLALHLDISRYLTARRPDVPDDKLYFTKSAAMDLYEVLRQLIDGTDRQQYCLTVVTAPLGLLQDDKRGISIYQALRDRTVDDVHDRIRANPMASLVRLAHCGEPLPVDVASAKTLPPALETVHCQRAVEALRCGVPNEDAVRELDSFQPHVHQRFQLQLERLIDFPDQQSPGMIIAGGFGGGKSHLLQYLQREALKQNFACSSVVISKETPLFDPARMFTSAMRQLRLPGNHCNDLDAVAQRLETGSTPFAALETWLKSNRSNLNERFAATLFLYTQSRMDPEFQDRLIRYWCGDHLLDSEIKRRLRQLGELQSYSFERIPREDLALQRFRFAARLMIAAGYNGWVLLLDEAELMGRYSLLQRARSYGQMARFLGRVSDWSFEGMTSVIAITDDFQSAVIEGKNDIEKVPNRLLARGAESDRYLAGIAEHCMQIIQKDRIVLRSPDKGVVEKTCSDLQRIYNTAYACTTASATHGEYLSTSRMRHFVKRWITEWDLQRFYPGYAPDIATETITTDYSEDRILEHPSEDNDSSEPDDGSARE